MNRRNFFKLIGSAPLIPYYPGRMEGHRWVHHKIKTATEIQFLNDALMRELRVPKKLLTEKPMTATAARSLTMKEWEDWLKTVFKIRDKI